MTDAEARDAQKAGDANIRSAGPLGIDLRPRLDRMDDARLASENTRTALAKLLFEFDEQRSWRWKVLFTSIIAPFGSVVLLLGGWYGSHVTERRHATESAYTRAARQLASHDPAVRLSSVKTLDHYVTGADASWLAKTSERIFTSKSANEVEQERSRETMALLIGSLSREGDAAVLDAIADAANHHPGEAAQPVISMNKTAAVAFARAAGEFAGLSVLHDRHATILKDSTAEDLAHTLPDIDIYVLRTGSPFQASTRYNPRFSPRDMLSNTHVCQFKQIFDLRGTLAMGSDLNANLRDDVPTNSDLNGAMDKLIVTAAILERSSYILGRLIDQHGDIIDHTNPKDGAFVYDLFGTAVVVGRPTDAAIAGLRKRGGYFNAPEFYDHNPGCTF